MDYVSPATTWSQLAGANVEELLNALTPVDQHGLLDTIRQVDDTFASNSPWRALTPMAIRPRFIEVEEENDVTMFNAPESSTKLAYNTDRKQWESAKPIIKRLYVYENKQLKEVMTIMERDHGLRGSLQQYKKRFRIRDFRKYNRESDVVAVLPLLDQRDGLQDLSEATLPGAGRRIDLESARRYARRRGLLHRRLPKPRNPMSASASLQKLCRQPGGMFASGWYEVTLRATRYYVSTCFETGLWTAGQDPDQLCERQWIIKPSIDVYDTYSFFEDHFTLSRLLSQDRKTQAATVLSRMCHHAKALLLAQQPRLISYLGRASRDLYTQDAELAKSFCLYLSIMCSEVHGLQHPLSVLLTYLASIAEQPEHDAHYQALQKVLHDGYSSILGASHLDSL